MRKFVISLALLVAITSMLSAQQRIVSLDKLNGTDWMALTSSERVEFARGYLLGMWTVIHVMELFPLTDELQYLRLKFQLILRYQATALALATTRYYVQGARERQLDMYQAFFLVIRNGGMNER